MATPFEELEYLSENLPDEGQSVIISRMYGDLVCLPYQAEVKSNPIQCHPDHSAQHVPVNSMELGALPYNVVPQQQMFSAYSTDERTYGQLMHLKLVMHQTYWLNLFPWAIGIYWMCVLSHMILGYGWEMIYLDAGIIMIGMFAAFSFARYRVWKCFQKAVFPVLRDIVLETKRDKYELVASLRHFPELETVTKALCRWTV